VTVAWTGLSLSGFTVTAVDFIAPWLYVAVAATAALSSLLQGAPKGGERPCNG